MQPESQQLLNTDIVAWVGAVTGIIGMLSGLTALGWDVFKWRVAEHPKIKASIKWHMTLRTGGLFKDLDITVENLGVRATTITGVWLTNGSYGWFGRPQKPTREFGGLVFNKDFEEPIPYVLNPGQAWVGTIDPDNEHISEFMKLGNTYFLITHTLAKKAIAIKITQELKDLMYEVKAFHK